MKKNLKAWMAWLLIVTFFSASSLAPGLSAAQQTDETGEDTSGLSWSERRKAEKAERLLDKGINSYESRSWFWAERRLRRALELDPSLYEGHKYLALTYREQGLSAEAYNQLVKYLAAAPEDTDMMLLAGITGVEAGQGQRARIYLETGLDKSPGDVDALMALGKLNYQEGYEDTARQNLEKVVSKDASRGEAFLILGKIYRDQGDAELARKNLEKAADLMPQSTEADYILATMAYESGDFKKAITHFQEIAGKHEPAEEVYYLLAVSHLAEGNNEEALNNFEKTIKEDPAYEQAAYQAGFLYKEKGETAKAIDRFRLHADNNPGHFESRYELADIYLEQGDLKKAEQWLEAALEIQPESSKALLAKGKLAYERGAYEEAYPYLRKALALDPENAEIRYLLSETYLHLPDFSAAERELQWIIKRADSEEAKQKLNEVKQKKDELTRDSETGVEVSSVKTLAVADFKNVGSERGWEWMQKGLAEIVVSDLAVVTSVEVVDPAAVDKLMREQKLDPGSASPAFKRLGAQAIMTGSYTVRNGDIKLDARLVDTETSRVIATGSRSGDVDDVFMLERDLTAELVSKYVPLTRSERDTLASQPTISTRALKDLAKGKELYYLGKGEQAKEYISKVADRNPDYTPALADLRAVEDAVSSAETLAIMPFKNATGNSEYDWMGMGISESLTTDLKKITGIYLVERNEIDQALEELKLGMLGFLDEESAPQVGQLVGAGVILVGSYQVANKRLRIDARMVDVETGSILLTEKIQGYEDDIFKLEEQLAMKIADALNVSLTAEEMAALKEKPNIENFKRYIISQSSFRVGEEGSAEGDEEVIRTVAVSRFQNYSGQQKYDFLEEAIPGYLVTELKTRAGMNMIERDQLDKVMQEMAISKTSYLDEKNAPQVGQMVGADAVLVGFFQVQKNEIRVDARVIKTSTGEVLKTVSTSGNVNDIFAIEEQLATEIMAALGVEGGAGGSGLAEEGGRAGGRAPIMAATYSFFLPGSSQYYINEKKTKGTIMLVSDVLLILGAAFLTMSADQSFNDYAGGGDVASYNDGVDQLATRNMLVYGILGLGAYSAVDAYIGARKANNSPPPSPTEEPAQPAMAESTPSAGK